MLRFYVCFFFSLGGSNKNSKLSKFMVLNSDLACEREEQNSFLRYKCELSFSEKCIPLSKDSSLLSS